ncbi:glycosyltransferase [Desulfovibrio sp. OttesenSCG-928-M16]|nr:glycosyltransferase [Desulfovibrio sp. OttesenSCG-928-M16]
MAIKRIILNVSELAASFSTQYFFARNNNLLSKLGFDALHGQCVFAVSPDGDIDAIASKTKQAPFDVDAALRSSADTLVFFFRSQLAYDSSLFPLNRLRELFPHADIDLVYSFTRQDELAAGTYAYLFLIKKLPRPAEWLARRGRQMTWDHEATLSLLKTQCGEDARVLPSYDVHSGEQSSSDFLKLFGLDAEELADLGADFSQPANAVFSLPRELVAFCKCWHGFKLPYAPTGVPEPWATQAALFTKGSGYSGDFSSFFSPTDRSELLALYAESNTSLARALDLPCLFPALQPEPDWEPFISLTEESAYRVAKRLDRDFALARMAEFDTVPVQYMSRIRRLCHQALHDALDPPSAAFLRRPGEQPKLSVLTLAYNHAPYIAECIESVIAQKTNFPFQHIIMDDASSDGTQDIILEYAEKYPHIVPVFQTRRARRARKTSSVRGQNVLTLFDMARTEYAALCDGDDYFSDPTKLQTQMDFLEANSDCSLCFHIARVIYEDNPERERIYPEVATLPGGLRPFYTLEDLIRYNFMQTNTVMYRWRFRNGLPNWFRADIMPGDWYWHILHAETGKIGFINKVMSIYRRHKKAVYYMAEIDHIKHRAMVGMREMEFYDLVNKHFNRKYESVFLDMASGIFSDCLYYDMQYENMNSESFQHAFNKICDAYPYFALHFLRSLNIQNDN